MVRKMFHHGSGRLRPCKHLEYLAHRVLDFLIGIEHNLTRGIIDSSHRQPKTQRALLRFFELAADQPAVQPVQFRFAHRAAESSEQPIIVLPRIIDAIFVDHQSVGQGADFNQAIPVAAGAGQARRFSTEDGSRPPQADFGDERLKAIATGAGGPGAALILVDDDHEMLRPSQVLGALGQLVLAGRTRGIVTDLHQR